MTRANILRRICGVGAILAATALLGAAVAARPGLAETADPTPGTARIWIYRIFEPSITLATPYVRINGAIVAVAQLGSAFYRDVRPGTYLITVDSPGRDVNQFARVALAAGQTVYVKVDANDWWAGMCRSCEINTFYTLLMTPGFARTEMAGLRVEGGG
jgi:hypothetical protein